MVVVTIDLWKKGKPENKIHLGTAHIFNTGGTFTSGNYGYKLFNKAGRIWKTGLLSGFPRKRLLGFDLLFRALKDALGVRNE